MADFCQQCSIENFGEDLGDLKDLGPAEELQEGCGWGALCEGCGFTVVDQAGRCIARYCEVHGKAEENNDERD